MRGFGNLVLITFCVCRDISVEVVDFGPPPRCLISLASD